MCTVIYIYMPRTYKLQIQALLAYILGLGNFHKNSIRFLRSLFEYSTNIQKN